MLRSAPLRCRQYAYNPPLGMPHEQPPAGVSTRSTHHDDRRLMPPPPLPQDTSRAQNRPTVVRESLPPPMPPSREARNFFDPPPPSRRAAQSHAIQPQVSAQANPAYPVHTPVPSTSRGINNSTQFKPTGGPQRFAPPTPIQKGASNHMSQSARAPMRSANIINTTGTANASQRSKFTPVQRNFR